MWMPRETEAGAALRGARRALLDAKADLVLRGRCTPSSGTYGAAYNEAHQGLLDEIERRLAALSTEGPHGRSEQGDPARPARGGP